MAEKYTKSLSDWSPVIPKKSSEKAEELMSVTARDARDVLNADNELKGWTGGSGKPQGPFGSQGRKF